MQGRRRLGPSRARRARRPRTSRRRREARAPGGRPLRGLPRLLPVRARAAPDGAVRAILREPMVPPWGHSHRSRHRLRSRDVEPRFPQFQSLQSVWPPGAGSPIAGAPPDRGSLAGHRRTPGPMAAARDLHRRGHAAASTGGGRRRELGGAAGLPLRRGDHRHRAGPGGTSSRRAGLPFRRRRAMARATALRLLGDSSAGARGWSRGDRPRAARRRGAAAHGLASPRGGRRYRGSRAGGRRCPRLCRARPAGLVADRARGRIGPAGVMGRAGHRRVPRRPRRLPGPAWPGGRAPGPTVAPPAGGRVLRGGLPQPLPGARVHPATRHGQVPSGRDRCTLLRISSARDPRDLVARGWRALFQIPARFPLLAVPGASGPGRWRPVRPDRRAHAARLELPVGDRSPMAAARPLPGRGQSRSSSPRG